jgi:hypothetical protein
LSRIEFSSYRFPRGDVGVGDAHILGREGHASDRGNPADQHSLRDFCHERGHLGIALGTSPSSGGQLQDHQGGSGGEEIEGTVHRVLLLARMGEAQPAPNGWGWGAKREIRIKRLQEGHRIWRQSVGLPEAQMWGGRPVPQQLPGRWLMYPKSRSGKGLGVNQDQGRQLARVTNQQEPVSTGEERGELRQGDLVGLIEDQQITRHCPRCSQQA